MLHCRFRHGEAVFAAVVVVGLKANVFGQVLFWGEGHHTTYIFGNLIGSRMPGTPGSRKEVTKAPATAFAISSCIPGL